MNKSTKKLPFIGQENVHVATARVVCKECGDYREKGELAIFQPNRTDWDGTLMSILCSWECGLEISERGIVHSRIIYGMDPDQMNKFAKENPGESMGSFRYPKGHASWEKLVEFKRKMEVL